ncbi:unnamed protein product [Paramecium pentaurelia]|uniref:Uncharacterized protein n=1 Tax=Paramecium pentaurelia TaxID=43138 RepID=A0A8S1Y053_9CILI|nr:unnamed protein product [Paramecium pentaurelia]
MNIKIVYNTKTHKISSKYQTLEEIKNAIQILYPKQLNNGFDLYVTLHPQIEPFKILNQTCFNRIKDIQIQMNWPSIKFLVKDSTNPNLTNDDLLVLNQSVIVKSTIQLSTVMNLLQQPQQLQKDEFLNQKQQQQQIIIEDNKPQLQQNLNQEIIKQIEKQEFQGLDYYSEEFKQFVIERIDKRLQYHGILQNDNVKPLLARYKIEIIKYDYMISKNVNEKFEWQIEMVNKGDIIWQKNQVALLGLNGHFKNVKIELENDINPGETAKLKYLCQMPNYEIQNFKNQFQMTYIEQNQIKYFGPKISLIITTVKNNQNQMKEQKIKQLMDSAEISLEQAMEFIEMYGSENQIDEIILAYFEQPK